MTHPANTWPWCQGRGSGGWISGRRGRGACRGSTTPAYRPGRWWGAALVVGQRRFAPLRLERGLGDVLEAVKMRIQLRLATSQVANGCVSAFFSDIKLLLLLRNCIIAAALFTAAAAALAQISGRGLRSRHSFTASFLVAARTS